MLTFERLSYELGIELKKLTYIIYKIPDDKKYIKFSIPKKGGGKRQICKPVPKLLSLQRKIKDYLITYYKTKPCSYGFEINKDIKKNASQHIKSNLVLNIDIEDFFGSINFGRIYGLLLHEPFNFDKKTAAAVAKAVTYENKLPQGAPTSPVLSNMIARRLDSKLMHLAYNTRSIYTRYVDDMTFSTTMSSFHKNIIVKGKFNDVELSPQLITIIEREGFSLNTKKTRLLNKHVRKEVTGITINEFPNLRRNYINSVFGMIYSWKKYGYEDAQEKYKTKYLKLNQDHKILQDSYRSTIIGRIGHIAHIRGWSDVVVSKLCRKYCECDTNPPKRLKSIGEMSMKYDVFIGHASEQKNDIVEPLYNSLTSLGVRVFVDMVNIKWGDSLTKLINNALAESEYFLAIISIDSISKSWPDTEMNAAIARQIDGKQKVLPLFLGSKKEIEECKNHYSLLSDKLYKEWSDNPDELAQEIKNLLP